MAGSNHQQTVLVIAGPTASGKTELSLELAKKLGGEIINIDSIQFYKHFDIGSAKLPVSEQNGIPHHLIDILEPAEKFNVADYKLLADNLVKEIVSRGKVPIFVGGSTLYIKVLLHGLTTGMESNPELRDQLEAEELDTLVAELRLKDPELAIKIDLQNKRRVVRALESIRSNQQSVSEARDAHSFQNIDYQALIVVMEMDRNKLYARINKRTELMLKAGLVEETKKILNDYGADCPALKSLGYKEAIEYLNGKIDAEQLSELIAQNTRRFAKKQLTFWRNEPEKRSWKLITKNLSGFETNRPNDASYRECPELNKTCIDEICNVFSELRTESKRQIKVVSCTR